MSGYGSVTRGSPLGCIVGVLAILPLTLAVLGAYGLFKIHQIPVEERDPAALELITNCTVAGVIGSILLIGASVWILKKTDWKSYDADNPHSQA